MPWHQITSIPADVRAFMSEMITDHIVPTHDLPAADVIAIAERHRLVERAGYDANGKHLPRMAAELMDCNFGRRVDCLGWPYTSIGKLAYCIVCDALNGVDLKAASWAQRAGKIHGLIVQDGDGYRPHDAILDVEVSPPEVLAHVLKQDRVMEKQFRTAGYIDEGQATGRGRA